MHGCGFTGWVLDANSRPSFKELGDEFEKMATDPSRYLVIEVRGTRKYPVLFLLFDLVDFCYLFILFYYLTQLFGASLYYVQLWQPSKTVLKTCMVTV